MSTPAPSVQTLCQDIKDLIRELRNDVAEAQTLVAFIMNHLWTESWKGSRKGSLSNLESSSIVDNQEDLHAD